MKATHIDYMHPRHLRVVENDGRVVCYAPSCSVYPKLNRPGLPSLLPPRQPLKRPIVFDYGRKVVW